MKQKHFRNKILTLLLLLITFGCTTDVDTVLPITEISEVHTGENTIVELPVTAVIPVEETNPIPDNTLPVNTTIPDSNTPDIPTIPVSELEIQQSNDSYYQDAQKVIQNRLNLLINNNKAKNVIVFVSDGAGPSIVTATRIFEGQQKGMTGEENSLSFEKFPHVAVTKTYNDNAQTPDSAGTATAIFSGVKTKQGVIGIAKEALRGSCTDALDYPVTTIIELAENIGLSTGIVTTAKVTHATPAATYAHSAERGWEDIAPSECKDIASQLVEFPIGDGIDLVMGGGRKHFLSKDQNDHEDLDQTGNRLDGRDLTNEWSGTYIWNKEQFDQLDGNTGRILGLFNRDHMEYEYERIREHNSVSSADEPSLPEMTAKAIELLSKNPKGYFLMVEAGRVDHAAHAGNAYQMLNENLLFSQAVQKAMDSVNLEETLIIVTADHDHTVTLSGYAQRGNNILGLVKGVDSSGKPVNSPSLARDFQPYTSLNFATGPGAIRGRSGLTEDQVTSPDYIQGALIPFTSGTHSSTDVITYANGPMAYLVGGVIEQNYIFHVINQALKLSEKRIQ